MRASARMLAPRPAEVQYCVPCGEAVICIAVLLLAVLPARAEPASSLQPWQTPESWQRLNRGMSRFDVFRILGEPGKVASYDGFERWEYPDLLGEAASTSTPTARS